ncbi:MAG: NADH-quinone oxidoreductase subunit NuoE [Candidatus Marinimicrobia bacterium]|nr:NADH-quinone oxidoreductase subunit NuoE [Candidatus Neomarinimicrobiota bacterium]
MLITEHELLKDEIREWCVRYGADRGALLPILQEVQHKYGHISEFAMQQIADALEIHPVEVDGVVSFYQFLHTRTHGRFVIRLCRTVSCDMAGKDRVARQLENELGISFGATTPDGRFTLEWASCLGLCDQGPALLVNETVYREVTPEKVHEIVSACRRSLSAHAPEFSQEAAS